jgi:long-chain fatty acid transport protein
LFANVRWVNWSDFYVRPYQFGKITSLVTTNMFGYPDGVNLTDYSKDQYSANVGFGHKLTDKWSGVVYGGWDSGAGNPTSTLGPVEGYWAAGLGLQYNPTPQYFIAGGFKYVWLGDATAHSATHSIPGFEEASKVADFKDNTAVGYMMKIGYKF